MPKRAVALTTQTTEIARPAIAREDTPLADEGPLAQLGGRQFVQDTVSEFYHAIGKYLTADDCAEHEKQQSRQTQFLSHALSGQPEPMYSARASFLARGLNPLLFEALLEYFEARLQEKGCPAALGDQLVLTASRLYDNSQEPLSIAC